MTLSKPDLSVEEQVDYREIVAAEENTIVCIITGESKKATDKEKILQSIARTLSTEYGFDIADMERDYKLIYTDPYTGKNRRMTANLVVFENRKPHEQSSIIRVCIIQSGKTKATDQKNGIKLLEDAIGAIEGKKTVEHPGCQFGLWTNGSELHFMQKYYDRDEPDPIFEELADFPGKDESLNDLDRPDRQILRIAADESLLNTFKRCHDYIYGNQGKIKTAFWELLNIIFVRFMMNAARRFALRKGIPIVACSGLVLKNVIRLKGSEK